MIRRHITQTSYRKPGRLLPRRPQGLRGGSVLLRPREIMEWHTTGNREELLIVLVGRLQLEVQRPRRLTTCVAKAGECVLIPQGLTHRVLNRSTTNVRYLYVTGSAR